MDARLVIFTSLPKVGGHSTLTLGICRLMRPYFSDIEVWCKVMPEHGHSTEAAAQLEDMGCAVTMLSDMTGRLQLGTTALAVLGARRHRPDVFFALAMRHLSVVLAAAVGAKHSAYYHITHDLNAGTIARLRGCARIFSKVIFICPATYEQFPGAKENPQFAWVPQPSELPVSSPDQLGSEREHTAVGPCRFGLLGRLTTEKGSQVMLDFVDTTESPCSLRVAGSGPFAEAFSARSDQSNTVCQVIFQGAYSPTDRDAVLRKFFNSIDCLVVPSQDEWETLSMVALEAMQHGVPVIMCRAGGLVSFENPGLGPAPADVIELVDVADLPSALNARAGTQRPASGESVTRCRNHYLAHFSDAVILKRWLTLLKRVP